MAEMLRLAAVLYLIAIRQSFEIYPTRVTVQIRKLSASIMTFEGSGPNQRIWEDHGLGLAGLWIMTAGAILSDEKDKTAWFAKRLQDSICGLSVGTYGDLEDMLWGFSWIDGIHGILLRTFRKKLIL
ncbi:uncharacterized protein RCO7_05140 [Rhynchosporium graminicola]|uniref:Uncharacterized protein n=1 Tax=Rhynchosporium graminicola TaxID=2792576 RepID=A0A1E1L6H8_9HELO|nr:uncharacterized protein RCO7_05140 [Rhynchosporium commune]